MPEVDDSSSGFFSATAWLYRLTKHMVEDLCATLVEYDAKELQRAWVME
jgi:hypothetical protein